MALSVQTDTLEECSAFHPCLENVGPTRECLKVVSSVQNEEERAKKLLLLISAEREARQDPPHPSRSLSILLVQTRLPETLHASCWHE